jgi:HPt (histidine-containing phosphotransfer) domain-containing protein
LADGSGLGSQLVAMFLAETPSRIEAIERAAGNGDWTALKASAGDLKGMCALIGADPLAARCTAAGESAGPSAWTEAMAIRSEWERVQKALDGLMGVKTGA